MAVKCGNQWPIYLKHKEDCKLRKKSWEVHFKNKRIVMHDNTNIKLVKLITTYKQ